MSAVRELLVLRHAKSDWDAESAGDHDRALSGRGRKAARRVGLWMEQHGLEPDHVLCSSATRTRETLERVARHVNLDIDRALIDERIYLANLPALVDVLRASPPKSERVLLVAHAPGVMEIVEHLTGQPLVPDSRGKLFPTGCLARLDVHVPWSALCEGSATLVEFVRPRDLG